MDIIKAILIVVGILALLVVGYWVVGLIFGIFWLLVYAAIIGLIGYGGYRLLFGRSASERALGDNATIAIGDFEGDDRALEEIRRKLLEK
jgi:hypothetical protein